MTTTPGQAVLTYELAERFETAVRKVRTALQRQGLRTAIELDIAGRIRNELGAGVAPCLVLYVDDPAVLLEAVVFHRGAPLLIPQPVVITGNHRQSEVLVRSVAQLDRAIPESIRDPALDLLQRIKRTLEGVAEKEGVELVASS